MKIQRSLVFLITAICFVFFVPVSNAQTPHKKKNLQYAVHKRAKKKSTQLDLYWLENKDQKSPLIIYVHGGAWKIGDKARVFEKSSWANKRGFAFASLNYRLYPDAEVEQQAQDIADAIHWLKSNANSYNFDPNKMFLMGHSAGAHLVSLVGTDAQYLEKHEMKPTDLLGIIPIDGAGLNVPYQIENAELKRMEKIYQDVFGQDTSRQRQLSPFHHLESGKDIPPFLVLYVDQRKASAYQANEFVKKLKSIDGMAYRLASKAKLTRPSIGRSATKAIEPLKRSQSLSTGILATNQLTHLRRRLPKSRFPSQVGSQEFNRRIVSR